MTFLGLFGLLLGWAVYPFAFIRATRLRVAMFGIYFVVHTLAALVYYISVQNAPADTSQYYFDKWHVYGTGFGAGTAFVIYLVQWLKSVVGGTYLDYFFLFQAVGLWGIGVLMRCFEEIYAELQTEQPFWTFLVLLIPGLHFWTSAIGKDAPLFFSAALALWASMRIKRRLVPLGVAALIMLVFRPHIALMLLLSLAIAMILDKRTGGIFKVVLLGLSAAAGIVIAMTIRSAFAVDVTSVDALMTFYESQAEVTAELEGSTAVIGASFPVRMLSLLFRPFFFDSEGGFGLIVSMENLAMVFIIGLLVVRVRDIGRMFRNVMYIRCAVIFFAGMTILLSSLYYNVGLGLRQRTMYMPALLMLFVSVLAVRQTARRQFRLSYA